jgi:predicted DNA-binding protein
MTLIIELPPDVEERLQAESCRKGVAASQLAREIIESPFPQRVIEEAQRARNQRAIELLRELREEGDEQEQRETFEALKEGLNASHSSYRTIFP